MSWFHQLYFSFDCTTEPGDFTASYKLRSLKHLLRRGSFKLSNGGVQTGKHQINKCAYHRPAKQCESDFSMTNKVHDINFILLVFLTLMT